MKRLFDFLKKKELEGSTLYAAYRILPEYKLIIQLYKGDMTLTNLKEYKSKLFSDPAYNPLYSTLEDVSHVYIKALLTDVDEYVNFLKKTINLGYNEAKHSWIYDSVNQFVYLKELEERYKIKDFSVSSSIQEGLGFIEKSELQSTIEQDFKELQKEFIPYHDQNTIHSY